MALGKEILDLLIEGNVATAPLRIVFSGSAARGQARPDSDIDLMIVFPDGTNPRFT